jgi:hypothetical protein
MLKEGKAVKPRDLDKFFNKSDKIDRLFNEIITWGDK